MTQNCVFCKIINEEIPAEIIYQDEQTLAFHDLNPASPVHILVIPRKHIASLAQASVEDELLLGHLLLTAQRLARQYKIDQSGYRVLINSGPDAGQTVEHLHVHLMGGHPLGRLTR